MNGSMDALLARRLLLVTGKGGVGKTTISAALARAAAKKHARVLVAEISYESPRDEEGGGATAVSPLASALGVPPLVDEPRKVVAASAEGGTAQARDAGLFAARLSPLAGHHQFLRDTLPVRLLADAAMRSAAVRRFFHAAPTLAELGILYRLLDLLKGPWDVVVCDLPATGHALALAQVPQALATVLRAGPIHAAAQEGLSVLRDPKRTTSVLVSLPDPLPVSEALELHEGLRKLAIDCAMVVLNRVPPNPFTPDERAAVDRLVLDRGRTLGARRLPRIERAAVAHDRLVRELRLPVRTVRELGGDVVARVAAAFEGGS